MQDVEIIDTVMAYPAQQAGEEISLSMYSQSTETLDEA